MDLLFIHPNFLGQFRAVATALSNLDDYNVYGIGETKHCENVPQNITVISYDLPEVSLDQVHRYNRPMEKAVRRAEIVCAKLIKEKQTGFEPDVIFVHPGWGDAFLLKEIFPMTPVVGFFEYYYHARGVDVGFDPEFPMVFDDIFRLKILNAVNLLSLASCDVRISPTLWQKSLFPEIYSDKIRVLHEGIDTNIIKPNPEASFDLPNGQKLIQGDEVLTYVSRSLEPYRGYHQFMRALPEIMKERPNVQVLIVGNHEVSYGKKPPEGTCYKDIYLDEVKDEIDISRVHFLGAISYADYLNVLQVSRAHIYLTCPFVLSWSALEALSMGCVMIASDTTPIQEVITDKENGLLVDFFNTKQIAQEAVNVLSQPEKYQHIKENARKYAIENFDFETVSLVQYKQLIDELTQ